MSLSPARMWAAVRETRCLIKNRTASEKKKLLHPALQKNRYRFREFLRKVEWNLVDSKVPSEYFQIFCFSFSVLCFFKADRLLLLVNFKLWVCLVGWWWFQILENVRFAYLVCWGGEFHFRGGVFIGNSGIVTQFIWNFWKRLCLAWSWMKIFQFNPSRFCNGS